MLAYIQDLKDALCVGGQGIIWTLAAFGTNQCQLLNIGGVLILD
jgi:hypothetical protein